MGLGSISDAGASEGSGGQALSGGHGPHRSPPPVSLGRSQQATFISGEFAPPAPADLAPLFPQLEILELLGKGGMGAVYKARQPTLDRLVALKILPPSVAGDPAFAERFTREARALARINHPHIVGVYEFGQTQGLYYFVMEFVDGANLRSAIQTGKLGSAEALAIVPQICEALQFAHDEGVVHRDIKPENILIDKRGRVKIADFGLAKIVGEGSRLGDRDSPAQPDYSLTGTHQVMGTMHYMAPEQIEKPLTVDHRADIYSLGVVFYEMLTGELPIGRFAPPSQKVHVDVRLDEVVLRTLEKDPGRRYQHAGDVKTEVESIGRVPLPPANLSPRPGASAADVDLESVRRQLHLPAIGITASAIVNGAFVPLVILWIVQGRFYPGLQAPIFVGIALLCSCPVASVFALTGAGKMRRLENLKLAVIGAIASILPFTPGFVVGLPFGIWALVVLSRADVLSAFKDDRDNA
jgi:predicted Ser/Thr protein kinase